ncbi:MAG: protein kinase, partial [Deltaproteobacteria bacterium]|nr:protein kinase [Deltaproteobacteria bacterium]
MATLFLAQREGARGFARHLAIKVVNEELAQDDVFVEMFIDEAKLAAQINHPNVVHVEDFGEADGNFFIAMEYIHGCSLAQLLRALVKQKRRLTPELAVYIAVKVAEGLHAAHEATDRAGESLAVVHRDVNPANVLLDYKGHVKLIDFGIAKSTSRAHHTTGGSLKGKLRYMSPEQALGKSIDRRADVYALGITFWEILTARRLFDALTDIQVLESVRNPDIDPPSRFAEGVSPELDEVVMTALDPVADDRTPTALEFRRQLTRVMPEAAMLESSTLAELLAIVMRKEIQTSETKLPEILDGSARHTPSREDDNEVLRTMTISDIGIEADDSTERTSVSNSAPGEPAAPREASENPPAVPDASVPPPPPAAAFAVRTSAPFSDRPPGSSVPPVTGPVGTPTAAHVSTPKARRWPMVVAAGSAVGFVLGVAIYSLGSLGDEGVSTTTFEAELSDAGPGAQALGAGASGREDAASGREDAASGREDAASGSVAIAPAYVDSGASPADARAAVDPGSDVNPDPGPG